MDEIEYYQRRALSEMRAARSATHPRAVEAHLRLARLLASEASVLEQFGIGRKSTERQAGDRLH